MNKKTKKGAASFYIVAFSTLILIIIAMSFAAVIISQMARTSNEDLAQSAYDSALAGVEDAKLAYMSYQKCVESGETATGISRDNKVTCGEIIQWVENESDCLSVAHILGRVSDNVDSEDVTGDKEGEVQVKESSEAGNNMQQAYTCAKIETSLKDYRSTLNSSNQVRVVKVGLDDVNASDIKRVRVSWYSDTNGSVATYSNFSGNNMLFPSLVTKQAATPPIISVGMIQTSGSFSMNDFEQTVGEKTTDRAMVYLVPTGNKNLQDGDTSGRYTIAFNAAGENSISAAQMAKSNDKVAKNLPYAVYCDTNAGNEFACSATLELPDPVGGNRNNDTFIFVISVPYGKPSTDFALEFFCDTACPSASSGTVAEGASNQANLKGTQISVDSTGRANDLFRRVETRLEPTDATFPYPLYAIQLLDPDSQNSTLKKKLVVTSEWNFL